ncbi:DUF485 domain-containing protein [Lederbergia citrea]|uniref:DUF485 domain-containing protein n=1 Tax=Lederbergia citrea TaxID=2833581 RepID=A0A942USK5_9BACI|nr:DUF485 domain-containing protein [Lederbergia citrea]MBS4178723.1 DUF485 domain-containing protein [Lederbergia citrea]MBS4224253.1 DUF485 domain-containing protein [Lederbergia citrea]
MAKRSLTGSKHNKPAADFEEMERSIPFQELLAAKRRFLIPSIILFFGLYLLFPILISYTNVLDKPAIGDISWTWIYALLLFVMTWVLATIYMKKAAGFDRMAEKVWKEEVHVEGRKAR